MIDIRTLIFDKRLSQRIIAQIMGCQQSEVSLFANRKREMSQEQIQSLVDYFGQETIEAYTIPDTVVKPTSHGATSTPIARIEQASIVRDDEEVEVDIESLMLDTNTSPKDIAKIIGEDIEYLRRCNNRLYPRHIMKLQDRFGDALVDKYAKYSNVVEAEIIESFPIVPEAVIAEPNVNIEEVIEEDGTELEAISPNLLLSNMKVNAAEQIKGTSMLPTFQPNDWVFIRFLKDKMKIVSGKTYYLNCRNRPTMIRRVKFEGEDKLRLIAKNSEYDDIIICRSDIINIGNVVAMFRMTFGDQYSELEELRREKDAERAKKDSQIDKMLDMMQAQGEQQSKLIDHITKSK